MLKTVLALLLCSAAFAQSSGANNHKSLPPVYLNHIDIYVGSELYRAIGESEFLRKEFANFEERDTSTNNGSYSGEYLYGRTTFLEFTPGDPSAEKDGPPGVIGFGLSIDDRRQLLSLAKALDTALHGHCEVGVHKLNLNAKEILWYDAVQLCVPDTIYDSSFFWVQALYPTYLKERYPDLKTNEDGTSREQANARRYRPDLLFKDIQSVTLGVEPNEIPAIAASLKALGFTLQTQGATTRATGPETTFRFEPVGENPRTVELQLTLSHNKSGQQVYTFAGGSELHFYSNQTATWTFPGAIKYDKSCATDSSRKSLPTALAKLCPH